ncbi:hypothetical protein LCGC14_1114960 [marine sediment metagenome]|uniref:Sulfotransferase domain-containing protein n=1 Tax=marine sediment metagenome TaxID=412755 RepID=A0A0F9PNN6_9ZZZZ
MKTLITGVGSCGTTFLARLFMELGCDLGDNLNAVERPRGMEHRPLAQLLTDWDMRASPYPMPAYKVDHRDVGGATIEEFFGARDGTPPTIGIETVSAGLPEVVKSPLMPHWLHTWLRAGGTQPEVVIVCTRPLRDTAASFVHHAKWLEYYSLYMWQATRLGLLWDTIQEHRIPYVTIKYPRMIHDASYLWRKLYRCADKTASLDTVDGTSFQEFKKAHDAIAKPELVGKYGNS